MARFNTHASKATVRIPGEGCCKIQWCQHLKDDLARAIFVVYGNEELSKDDKRRIREIIDSGKASDIFESCQRHAHEATKSTHSRFTKKVLDGTTFLTGFGSVINLSGAADMYFRYAPMFSSEVDEEKELGFVWAEVGEHIWDGLARFSQSPEQQSKP
jgi:hypothetical protein